MSGRRRKVIHLIKTGIIKKRWMRRGFERERRVEILKRMKQESEMMAIMRESELERGQRKEEEVKQNLKQAQLDRRLDNCGQQFGKVRGDPCQQWLLCVRFFSISFQCLVLS